MKVIRLNPDNFDTEVLQAPLAVVTFWADWCEPCGNFMPRLNLLAKEFDQRVVVAKVNIDEYPILAKQFDVQGIPHTFIFIAGKQVDKCVGAIKYEHLKALVESALTKAAELVSQPSEPATEKSPTPKDQENTDRGVLKTIKDTVTALIARITGKK